MSEITPEQREFDAICEQSRRLRDLFADPDAALAGAEARGYRAGVEDAARECRLAAAEALLGQVRPGQPRRVVTRPMARMAIRCAQRIRALADKPKETPHGNG